ncbi:MAG: hypothetical protein AAB676_15745 [Verrucomicrobiota bacterium]
MEATKFAVNCPRGVTGFGLQQLAESELNSILHRYFQGSHSPLPELFVLSGSPSIHSHSPRLRRFLCVFEFLFVAPVAAALDHRAGFLQLLFVAEEAGAVEVDVGQMQPLMATLGDWPGFVEVQEGASTLLPTNGVEGSLATSNKPISETSF